MATRHSKRVWYAAVLSRPGSLFQNRRRFRRTYQFESCSIVKLLTRRAARVGSYDSIASIYEAIVVLRSDRIQRSISGRSNTGTSGSLCVKPSMFAYRAKNAYVLRSVPKNFRCTSAIASTSNSFGFHVGLLAIRNQRTLSALYLSMTSNGSTVLPRVLDIFCPVLSKTRSLQMTFLKQGCLNKNELI